jgi:DNA-binding response OmpR family regulator
VLVIEDDAVLRSLFEKALVRSGWDVRVCAKGGEALGELAARSFDLAVVDLTLPDISGAELIARLRERSPLPLVMMSGVPCDFEIPSRSVFLQKPFRLARLLEAVEAMGAG